jgi:hypothetical protein
MSLLSSPFACTFVLRRTILARLGPVRAKNVIEKISDVVPCDIVPKAAAILHACRVRPGSVHLLM